MPTYEVEINGETFEIEAPDDQAVQLAVRQLQAGQETAPAPAADGGGVAGAINSFGAGVADMATFGFADELGAGARYLGGKVLPWQSNVSYDEALQEVRGQDKQAAEANPGTYLTGQVVGGVGTALGLGKAGVSGAGLLGNPASLAGRVGVGAAEGAAFGGLYGAGSGEGAGGRMTEAAKGAALGGAVGGAVPIIAQGASSAYRNVADRLAAGNVARDAGVSPEVARMLTETLDADGSLGARGTVNMSQAGKEAMLVDAGPNARAVLDTSIQRGGQGSVMARGRIDERVTRGANDLTAALDASMGKPGESLSRELIVYGDKTNPLNLMYKKAYAQPIDYSKPAAMEIESMVKNRVPKAAVDAANNLMRVEGLESSQILAKLADDGTVVFETLPDVRQLDYITRGLGQVAEEANGKGQLGGTTPIGRAYGNLSRDIRSRLKELVPEYNTALNRAGTEIGKVKAGEFGETLLSDSVTRANVREFVEGIPNAERNSLKQAVRQNIDDRIARVKAAFTDPNLDAREAASAIKSLSSRANRDKLSAVLGEAEAGKLFDEIDRVSTSFGVKASVAENSKTFARQAVSGRIEDITAPGAVKTLAQGKPLNAAQRIAQALTGQTPEKIAARQDAIYSEIADFLTRPAEQSIPAFRAMTDFGNQTATNQARSAAIARLLSETGRPLVYPSAAQLRN